MTLEDDVMSDVQREVRNSGRSFKAVINDAIRAGMVRGTEPPRQPFRVNAVDMGLRPGFDLDDIEGLLDHLEGPRRR